MISTQFPGHRIRYSTILIVLKGLSSFFVLLYDCGPRSEELDVSNSIISFFAVQLRFFKNPFGD